MSEGRAAAWCLSLPAKPGWKLYTYAAGTTTHLPVWKDANKNVAATSYDGGSGIHTPATADPQGWLCVYGDGDYRFDIVESGGLPFQTIDPIRVTADTSLIWENSNGTTLPSVGALNDWQMFVKNSGAGTFDGLFVNDGVRFRQINNSFISVTDHGALGDGENDDTASIQAAIDAAKEGDTVFFPGRTTGYVVATGPITLPSDRAIRVLGGGSKIVLTEDVVCFKISSGVAADAPRHHIDGFQIWGQPIGRGTGVLIVDSNHQTISNCFLYRLKYGVENRIEATFSEAHSYSWMDIRDCTRGMFFSRTGGNFSQASQHLNHVAITTANSVGVAYGIYQDTSVDLYRSSFTNVKIFPAGSGSTAYFCDGRLRNVVGQLNLEGNNLSATGNVGVHFGSTADLLHPDLNMDIRGNIVEQFKYDDAATVISGFKTQSTTEPGTILRHAGTKSPIFSVADATADSTTAASTNYHWIERVTSSDRYQIEVNQDTPPEFVRHDGVSFLAPVRLLDVGNGLPGQFSDSDLTPDVKGKTFMRTATTGGAITDFENGVAGQKLTVLFVNGTTSIIHDTGKIRLSTSADFNTAAADDILRFLYDGTIWREISRILVA